ncbi:MAG: GntR family transcriptional regulator [Clostridia bacterium]|nr:GntR family transcriptional regulator [Clostridia bacterium]
MNNKTLSEEIYDELYRDITKQELKCGQKLTLQMLKDRFHISHTPIREALMRLAEHGLVVYYSNVGVKVVDFTEDEIRELYQFAAELDAMAIQFCGSSPMQEPLLMELEEIIEASENALNAGNMDTWKEYSESFHTAFYRHAHNSYLEEAAAKLRAKLELFSCMYYKDQNIQRIHNGHAAIFEQVKAGKFRDAAAAMRKHLHYDMALALRAYAEQDTEKR